MYFRVTANYVKQQNRKSVYVALLFTALIAGCVVALVNAKAISDMVFQVIGIFLFALSIFRTYKRIKAGASSYPVVELDAAAGKIAVSYKDVIVTVDIMQIKNLRLQHKSENIVSVIVTTSSGEVMRFEGYENLEILASTLEHLTPRNKVTNAAFYHR